MADMADTRHLFVRRGFEGGADSRNSAQRAAMGSAPLFADPLAEGPAGDLRGDPPRLPGGVRREPPGAILTRSLRGSVRFVRCYGNRRSDTVRKLRRQACGCSPWEHRRYRPHEGKVRQIARLRSIVASGPFSKPEKIVEMINEVFDGISGLKGIHCCGNTDWSILLKTKIDILNFDAYDYAQSLGLYPDEVKAFIGRGGCVAWGIVPNHMEPLGKESVSSLKDRLEEAMAPFTRNGLSMKDIVKNSLLLPACGLNALTEDGVEQVLKLLTELSAEMRRRYS